MNAPCCGSVTHFDLSYFAFEKLAHPVRPEVQSPATPYPLQLVPARPLRPGLNVTDRSYLPPVDVSCCDHCCGHG